MFENWTPGDWFGFIACVTPILFGASAAVFRAIKHLGAIERLLSDLSKWMHQFGQAHTELRVEVQHIRGEVDRAHQRIDDLEESD